MTPATQSPRSLAPPLAPTASSPSVTSPASAGQAAKSAPASSASNLANCNPQTSRACALNEAGLEAAEGITGLPPVPSARVQEPAPNGTTATTTGSTTPGSPLDVANSYAGDHNRHERHRAFLRRIRPRHTGHRIWRRRSDARRLHGALGQVDRHVQRRMGGYLRAHHERHQPHPEDISHVADVSRIIGDSEKGVPETQAGKHPRHVRSARRNGETKSAADASTSRKGAERSEPSAELN